MIENREPAITETLRMEGGGQYTDRATDRGGPTRWGVAHKTLALSRGVPSVTPEEVMDLTEGEAKQVYRTLFWNAVNGDKLPSGIDFFVFQISVLSGVTRASKMLQEVAQQGDKTLVIDGQIGERTLAAVRAMRPLDVLLKLSNKWLVHVVKIPGEANDAGWVNRNSEGFAIAESLLQKRPMVADAAGSKIIKTNAPTAAIGLGSIGYALQQFGPQILAWLQAKADDPATLEKLQSGVSYIGQSSTAMHLILVLLVALTASVGANVASVWWRNRMWRRGEV